MLRSISFILFLLTMDCWTEPAVKFYNSYDHNRIDAPRPPFQLEQQFSPITQVTYGNGFCNPLAPPECLIDKSLGFCLDDFEYPEDDIKAAFEDNWMIVDQRWRSHLVVKEIDESCGALHLLVKPLRARNIDDDWRIIVQDVNEVVQRIPIGLCLNPDSTCSSTIFWFSSCSFKSRCIQQYLPRRMLSFDPCHPERGVFKDTFKMPSTCSCRLSLLPC